MIETVCSHVARLTGVQLGPKQRSMVESRIRRRISELQLDGFEAYQQYLNSSMEKESESLVSLLTTHHTYFFREFEQFEYLESQLPALAAQARARGAQKLEIWSAACSYGHEVYSLAMHLDKHLPVSAPGMGFSILGTDVDKESTRIASNGVYKRAEIKEIPLAYLNQHWARGNADIADFVKAKKSLREHCDFRPLSLLELQSMGTQKFDVIFCRNVFIYFTPDQIKSITAELIKHLHPGGMLFVGLSESLRGQDLPITAIAPSVYAPTSKTNTATRAIPKPQLKDAEPKLASAPKAARPIRVVCIDDSPSIISLMKKILGADYGFEVVGTAINGEEGAKVVAEMKPDVVTLDLHMPVCSGIEFLQRRRPGGPAVVVVSSVSRDDAGLALQALNFGASDYVEKPTLNNLTQRGDELRTKLKSACRQGSRSAAASVDREFAAATKIERPEDCVRVILFSLADIAKCAALLKEIKGEKVPVYLAIEGADSILPEVAERLTQASGMPISLPTGSQTFPATLGELRATVNSLRALGNKKISIMVLGEVSTQGGRELTLLPQSHLVLEDLGGGRGTESLEKAAADIVPATSFIYLSTNFLAGKK